jgi:hypothetical protein
MRRILAPQGLQDPRGPREQQGYAGPKDHQGPRERQESEVPQARQGPRAPRESRETRASRLLVLQESREPLGSPGHQGRGASKESKVNEVSKEFKASRGFKVSEASPENEGRMDTTRSL